MVDLENMSNFLLILYGTISGLIAFLIYELAQIVFVKEVRQRVKKNILSMFDKMNNSDNQSNDKNY